MLALNTALGLVLEVVGSSLLEMFLFRMQNFLDSFEASSADRVRQLTGPHAAPGPQSG